MFNSVYLSGFFKSCRRLPETKRHSSLFLHWSGYLNSITTTNYVHFSRSSYPHKTARVTNHSFLFITEIINRIFCYMKYRNAAARVPQRNVLAVAILLQHLTPRSRITFEKPTATWKTQQFARLSKIKVFNARKAWQDGHLPHGQIFLSKINSSETQGRVDLYIIVSEYRAVSKFRATLLWLLDSEAECSAFFRNVLQFWFSETNTGLL